MKVKKSNYMIQLKSQFSIYVASVGSCSKRLIYIFVSHYHSGNKFKILILPPKLSELIVIKIQHSILSRKLYIKHIVATRYKRNWFVWPQKSVCMTTKWSPYVCREPRWVATHNNQILQFTAQTYINYE